MITRGECAHMRFRIEDCDGLSKKLALNLKAVSTNKIVESFKNFKLKIENQKMEIVSYNGENCIISNFAVATCDEGCVEFLVDAGIFKSVIDKFNEFNVSYIDLFFDKEKEFLNISFNGIKYNLKVMKNVREFSSIPTIDNYKNYKTMVVNTKMLRRCVMNTQKCASKDKAKPMLEAVNMVVDNDRLDIMSIDGYRLALNNLSCTSDDNFTMSLSSSGAIPILLEVLKGDKMDYVEINSNGVYVMLENSDTVAFLKQISDKVPDYNNFLRKQEGSTTVKVNKKDLERALAAAKIGTNGVTPVKLVINARENKFVIKSMGNPASADVLNECEIPIDSEINSSLEEELIIAFNNTFFAELLNSLYTENCILTLYNSTSPMFLENEDTNNAIYLLLPVRIH
jgi:DNA polymerase-3 subunit beta